MSSSARVGRPRRNERPVAGDVREQVLTAATQLFATKGVSGTTVRELAAEAGLTASSLYYYFDSKESVLQELVAEVNRVFRDEIRRINERGGSAASRLYRLIRRDVELLDALPYDLNETLRISTLQDERFAWFWADREALYDAVEEIVTSGIAAGEFTAVDARLVARAVLANDRGVRNWFGLGPLGGAGSTSNDGSSYPPETTGRFLADIMLGGLLADRGRLDEIRREAEDW